MSFKRNIEKCKLIISFFSKDKTILDKVEKILEKKYGKIDFKSNDLFFDETDYYKKEMGEKLLFRVVSFERLVKRDSLVSIKKFSWKIERKNSIFENGVSKRLINIDPGILSLENFVLATGKGFAHRVYLGKGVFADLTLIYRNSTFIDLPWTYLNYKSQPIKDILLNIRKLYYSQIKAKKK